MDDRKVAIVIDNSMQVSKDLSLKISQKFSSVEVFDFSEDEVKEFSVWSFLKLHKLVYKVEQLDLSGFDTVYTISTGFANGVITNLDTKHINIFVNFNSWFYDHKFTFLKHKFRTWIGYATQRAEKNFYLYESVARCFKKLNYNLELEFLRKQEFLEMDEKTEKKDHFVLVTESQNGGSFIEECVKTFNQTGKKLYLIGSEKLNSSVSGFSEHVEFVSLKNEIQVNNLLNSARGILFDKQFFDFELLTRNLKSSVPVLSYRNNLITELFDSESVFELKEIESFENEIAKFVSWAKTKSDLVSKMKVSSLEIE